jgi:hypothetical protein
MLYQRRTADEKEVDEGCRETREAWLPCGLEIGVPACPLGSIYVASAHTQKAISPLLDSGS